MMYSELVNEVILITNKPDFAPEISAQVLKATRFVHTIDFWPRDRRVDYYTFDTSSFIQTLSIRDSFPNWRAWSFIRKYYPGATDWQTELATGAGKYPLIDIVDPQALFDEYYSDKVNVAYQAGDNLVIRSSDSLQYALIGWYLLPRIVPDDGQFNSWIAEAMPHAIIDKAAQAIFKMIGYDEQFQQFRELNAEHLQLMRTNFTTTVGY